MRDGSRTEHVLAGIHLTVVSFFGMSDPSPSDHQLLHATAKSTFRFDQAAEQTSVRPAARTHANAPFIDGPPAGDVQTLSSWQPRHAENVTSLHQASDSISVARTLMSASKLETSC